MPPTLAPPHVPSRQRLLGPRAGDARRDGTQGEFEPLAVLRSPACMYASLHELSLCVLAGAHAGGVHAWGFDTTALFALPCAARRLLAGQSSRLLRHVSARAVYPRAVAWSRAERVTVCDSVVNDDTPTEAHTRQQYSSSKRPVLPPAAAPPRSAPPPSHAATVAQQQQQQQQQQQDGPLAPACPPAQFDCLYRASCATEQPTALRDGGHCSWALRCWVNTLRAASALGRPC